jgi:hypothetical protein
MEIQRLRALRSRFLTATDPSDNQEVKLNAPCLGYHPATNTNEDNVLLLLDQSYDDNWDVVPLSGKMEYPSFQEIRNCS